MLELIGACIIAFRIVAVYISLLVRLAWTSDLRLRSTCCQCAVQRSDMRHTHPPATQKKKKKNDCLELLLISELKNSCFSHLCAALGVVVSCDTCVTLHAGSASGGL